MSRHTFVIQVYRDGPAMLENLSTQEWVPSLRPRRVGPQIERWLAASEEDDEREIVTPAGSGNGSRTGGEGSAPA